MCKIMDEFIEEYVKEQAQKMLADGLPTEKIAKYTNLPIETIKRLESEMQPITV